MVLIYAYNVVTLNGCRALGGIPSYFSPPTPQTWNSDNNPAQTDHVAVAPANPVVVPAAEGMLPAGAFEVDGVEADLGVDAL